jgi:hypothetical protein
VLTTNQKVAQLASERIPVVGILEGDARNDVHYRDGTSAAIQQSGIQLL